MAAGNAPRPVRPRPSTGRRSGARAAAVLVGVVGLVVAVVVTGLSVLTHETDNTDRAPHGDGLTPADVSRNTPVPQPAPLAADTDLTAWADAVSQRSGVPARALQAYGAAELAQRAATPDCRLSWVTIAGIGRVESDHARFGGAEFDADGVIRPSIIGVPLDGSAGVREIRDTDGGRLDGDPVYDRAVGPMQFLPSTWARYGADGNGDGVADPQQIDDAARTAANYLCADGHDTASGEGWWDVVLTYNRSVSYAQLVWAATDRYTGAATEQ